MDGMIERQTDFPLSKDKSSLNKSSQTKQLWFCTYDFIEHCLLSSFKLSECQIALINEILLQIEKKALAEKNKKTFWNTGGKTSILRCVQKLTYVMNQIHCDLFTLKVVKVSHAAQMAKHILDT